LAYALNLTGFTESWLTPETLFFRADFLQTEVRATTALPVGDTMIASLQNKESCKPT
jgi:hypothetical protein